MFGQSPAPLLGSNASIIIPCRNEAATILTLLQNLVALLPAAEILVIDGGADATADLVSQFAMQHPQCRYIKHDDDRGKGHAIRTGIQMASRPLLAQLDADGQFAPEDLLPMLRLLSDGHADFVCGSRFLSASRRQHASVPGLRLWGNRGFNYYASWWARTRLTDILSGLKVWRREVTAAFVLESDDFCYEVELPLKAIRHGFRLIDYPVTTYQRLHGASHVAVGRLSWQLLHVIPRFSTSAP